MALRFQRCDNWRIVSAALQLVEKLDVALEGGAAVHRGLYLFLGGAAVYRCDNCIVLNEALAAEVTPLCPGTGFSAPAVFAVSLTQINLTDSLSVKLSQADGQKQRVEDRQHYQHSQQRKVRELRHERSTQSFAGINQGIHQDDFLQNGKVC